MDAGAGAAQRRLFMRQPSPFSRTKSRPRTRRRLPATLGSISSSDAALAVGSRSRVVLCLTDNLSGDLLKAMVDRLLTGELRHRPRLQDQSSRVLEMAVMRTGFCAQEKMHRGQEPEGECLA